MAGSLSPRIVSPRPIAGRRSGNDGNGDCDVIDEPSMPNSNDDSGAADTEMARCEAAPPESDAARRAHRAA